MGLLIDSICLCLRSRRGYIASQFSDTSAADFAGCYLWLWFRTPARACTWADHRRDGLPCQTTMTRQSTIEYGLNSTSHCQQVAESLVNHDFPSMQFLTHAVRSKSIDRYSRPVIAMR